MNMQASNLAVALNIAAKAQAQAEERAGYVGPSALLQGWLDVLATLKRGESIQIVGTVDGGRSRYHQPG